MNGELVKRQDRWDLYAEDGSKIGSSAPNPMNKLSLKNCEAIANGYDLMKLAEENSHKYYDVKTIDWHCNYNGFFSGFQKALEILGDKKFQFTKEELVRLLVDFVGFPHPHNEPRGSISERYVQSLQQTEWDVEIVTEKFFKVEGDNGITIYAEAMEEFDERNDYKLDKDGCLILKRK